MAPSRYSSAQFGGLSSGVLVHDPTATSAKLPPWAEAVGRQVAGVGHVGRELVVAALYVAALVLLFWFVVGLIVGFVSPQALVTGLLGAGGAGTAGELLRRFPRKPTRTAEGDTVDKR